MPGRKRREEREIFHAYLRQNGLKKTYQKDLILETFLQSEGHMSIEDYILWCVGGTGRSASSPFSGR